MNHQDYIDLHCRDSGGRIDMRAVRLYLATQEVSPAEWWALQGQLVYDRRYDLRLTFPEIRDWQW